ncbi:hypothetical protein BDN72DRAFT_960728 [Pluteus cervinus]|uniref:Uncharacterized protein n=1 Tax=Pluteus cervinus TaxID=181527 RepID=A0ACD3AQK8_9AGAR|nr:hypothetical protein BDN72DRAFT_960728 [Pluteus cervinus]
METLIPYPNTAPDWSGIAICEPDYCRPLDFPSDHGLEAFRCSICDIPGLFNSMVLTKAQGIGLEDLLASSPTHFLRSSSLMPSFTRLLSLVSLAAIASAAAIHGDIVVARDDAPLAWNSATQPPPNDGPDLSTLNPTDSDTIASTAQQVDQKTGPTDDAPPSSDVPPTVVTAVDGDVTSAGSSGDSLLNVLHNPDSNPDLDTGSTVSKRDVANSFEKRGPYELVFSGSGTGPSDRDASIQGTAYLTFTRLDTYDLSACETFCDGIEACVFVNLFAEYNSDATYNPQYKCAAYGDTHTAAEKTNFGGQQLLPPPAGVSYVQQSVGYASATLVDPSVPAGYQLVFGPTNGANQAPGYMGFSFLDKYDVQACANLCNTRGADPVGGVCQYFNIWRALVDGNPTTYSCSFYYLPTDASTATNTGQGNLQVTYSRGYQRISTLLDGGFEDCGSSCTNGASSDDHWVASSPSGGNGDAILSFRASAARTGHSLGVLGSVSSQDSLSGTIRTNPPIPTVSGASYVLQFFHQSLFGTNDESHAVLNVFWNGVQVLSLHPGKQAWTPYQVAVTAVGSDVLSFTGGSWPAYDFLDDISLFLD